MGFDYCFGGYCAVMEGFAAMVVAEDMDTAA